MGLRKWAVSFECKVCLLRIKRRGATNWKDYLSLFLPSAITLYGFSFHLWALFLLERLTSPWGIDSSSICVICSFPFKALSFFTKKTKRQKTRMKRIACVTEDGLVLVASVYFLHWLSVSMTPYRKGQFGLSSAATSVCGRARRAIAAFVLSVVGITLQK